MPSKGTQRHAIRIPDALWSAALSLARSRGEHLSDIIRQALHNYIKHEGKNNGSE